MKQFKPSRNTIIVGAVIAVLLIVIAILGWKYMQNTKDTTSESQRTAARIEKAVGQIYLLPNEQPTVALIQDKEKLGNQEFFKKAQNGDYLLLYKDSKLALVYRESAKKLVNVGPINLDKNSDAANTANKDSAPEQPAKTNP